MRCRFKELLIVICLVFVLAFFSTHAEAQPPLGDPAPASGSWTVGQDDIEHAFSKGSMETGLAFGGAVGLKIFGSTAYHDFVLGSVHLGRIISDTMCAGAWYEGNWELLAELFGGYQINRGGAALVGLTPFVRYNFITHSRWIPFVEAGGGVSFTDISKPDLSTEFEFNLQAGMGIEYFFCPNLAATLQARYLHISNASIESPDHGANAMVFLVGLAWFM
jgi:opacity protein-like surface antigen